jgi:small subunit ribosomal protein S17
MENTKTKKGGKKLSGVVVSTKMKDTAVVRVDRFEKHPKYEKYFSIHKNFKVHDVGNTVNVGDKVTIEETKPISKDKRFKISNF